MSFAAASKRNDVPSGWERAATALRHVLAGRCLRRQQPRLPGVVPTDRHVADVDRYPPVSVEQAPHQQAVGAAAHSRPVECEVP